MQSLSLFLVLAVTASVASSPTAPAGNRIRGEWRGTSTCTNRELSPGCKDETVRYVFTGPIGNSKTYRVSADKLIGNDYQPMGDLDLAYDAADSTWMAVLDVPSCKGCRWWFRVRGSRLTGTLTTSAQDTLRTVVATRHSK